MYLKSDAVQAFERRRLLEWDWTSATILLVAYDWDTVHGGAEALAGRRLVRALTTAGARVCVLTGPAAAIDDAAQLGCTVAVAPCEPLAPSRIGRALQMMRTRVPEASGPWVGSAVDTGMRVLASLPEDTILYSRAMPGASNIVGWHLARRTGSPWVAHFSDNWPPPQVLPASRRFLAPYKWPLFSLWRHRILRDAGALTFTNPGQAAEMVGHGRSSGRRKAFVVTHLASSPPAASAPPRGDRFHIVHTGNLYPPNHTFETVLQGLRLFLDRTPGAREVVRFTQAGWANGDVEMWSRRCGLEDIVCVAGRLPQEAVLPLLESASLLIAIDYRRANSTTLLSKLPDYINARRPILALTAPTSTLGRVCLEDGAGLTAQHDAPEEVANHMVRVYRAWQQHRLDPFLPRPQARAAFATPTVLAELAGAFICARGAAPVRVAPAASVRRAPVSRSVQA
jgi:hypothetical protein